MPSAIARVSALMPVDSIHPILPRAIAAAAKAPTSAMPGERSITGRQGLGWIGATAGTPEFVSVRMGGLLQVLRFAHACHYADGSSTRKTDYPAIIYRGSSLIMDQPCVLPCDSYRSFAPLRWAGARPRLPTAWHCRNRRPAGRSTNWNVPWVPGSSTG